MVFALAQAAWGASTVQYSVALGGDNHTAAHEGGASQAFTPGTSGPHTYTVGQNITWDARVQASGIHSVGNFPIYGMANIVFDLKLHTGSPAGPLATGAQWFSTINDGDGGDPLRSAAFAYSYDIGGAGPARLIDTIPNGGPQMAAFTYPTPEPGGLIGMGAGFTSFNVAAAGVGMEMLPNGQPGLGVVPIAEGQINTPASPRACTISRSSHRWGTTSFGRAHISIPARCLSPWQRTSGWAAL
jgi:hypothetical protein